MDRSDHRGGASADHFKCAVNSRSRSGPRVETLARLLTARHFLTGTWENRMTMLG